MSPEAPTPPGSALCPGNAASPVLCLGFGRSADIPLPFSWDVGPEQGRWQPGGEGASACPPGFPVGDGTRAASWSWGHTCRLETATPPAETEPRFPEFSKPVLVQEGDLPDALGRDPPVPPVPPRGLRDAARPPGTCADTPGQPLSAPRRPQSRGPPGVPPSGVSSAPLGCACHPGPACPWCHGEGSAPPPASCGAVGGSRPLGPATASLPSRATHPGVTRSSPTQPPTPTPSRHMGCTWEHKDTRTHTGHTRICTPTRGRRDTHTGSRTHRHTRLFPAPRTLLFHSLTCRFCNKIL